MKRSLLIVILAIPLFLRAVGEEELVPYQRSGSQEKSFALQFFITAGLVAALTTQARSYCEMGIGSLASIGLFGMSIYMIREAVRKEREGTRLVVVRRRSDSEQIAGPIVFRKAGSIAMQ